MGILWIIIVGFIAGLIARFLAPGPNKPVGFLLTTALGIAGAFVATYIGQAVGWYRLDQGAGVIAATLGGSWLTARSATLEIRAFYRDRARARSTGHCQRVPRATAVMQQPPPRVRRP
jgi:uncharacterized membrane protein YeaQ/YmgE (transglycosylase-associated protein family)